MEKFSKVQCTETKRKENWISAYSLSIKAIKYIIKNVSINKIPDEINSSLNYSKHLRKK